MALSWNEIKHRALAFSRTWADASDENSQAKPFWLAFFEIFGITDKRVATFELAVKKHGGGQGFVDLFWPGMLLVEQKSRGKSLDAAFDQALGYFPGLPERDLPQLIIVCDFERFRVHRLATAAQPGEAIEFALKDLHKHVKLFGFMAGYKVQTIQAQNPVNIKAADRMGKLHDALKASGYEGHALEVLLVRLLFCLFADDTGIFQPAQAFRAFIEERTESDGSDLGARLAQVFQVLNTPDGAGGPGNTASRRSTHLDAQLAAFPYINGKLFEESLPLADFNTAMREALLDACALDWSAISPAIFGSLFQSIMNAEARRNLGAHYTSEENIQKLIKPLFLDALWAEFGKVKGNRNRLFEFHQKLRHLRFFDPACGCGNFLVLAYRELRLLELAVLRASHELSGHAGQQSVDVHSLIGVNVDQFHGIEIEEFPAQIAQVALWLMDHQMNLQVSEEFGLYFARIPLRTSPHIVHGNALTLDWTDVLAPEKCSFVLGNPPFLGKKEQSAAQKTDFERVMGHIQGSGVLDFVSAWYVKATRYMAQAHAAGAAVPACAFVSTNSITQGEQVGVLWGWLLAQGVTVHFAHRTFNWSNEAKGNAAVHCVIVGFELNDRAGKVIYEYDDIKGEPHAVPAQHINPYLVDAPDVLLASVKRPTNGVPELVYGSFALDDGHYTLDESTKDSLKSKDPRIAEFVRPFVGGEELLHSTPRWCLWFRDASPISLRLSPVALQRIEAVRKWRASRDRKATKKLANTPTLFAEIRQPSTYYLAIPTVSSERRNFIPIGFLPPEVIASNQLYVLPDATLFHFGILTSTMHNAWMRAVAGRLESRYRYSAAIVYNNFPWPFCANGQALPIAVAELENSEQKQPLSIDSKAQTAIETAAQTVLDARAHFPTSSLADLYDPLTMPPALLKAHQKLDAAVDKAYEACGGKKAYKNDAERVAFLFELYQRLTSLGGIGKAGKSKRKQTANREGESA